MAYQEDIDAKRVEEHHENIGKGEVADEAAGYVDPNVHISEEENKRLRKIIFTR